MSDPINHPPHYTAHKSGVECIQITEHMSFCLGNAVKYIWRADLKGDAVEDLRKAAWYLQREIERRSKAAHVIPGGECEKLIASLKSDPSSLLNEGTTILTGVGWSGLVPTVAPDENIPF